MSESHPDLVAGHGILGNGGGALVEVAASNGIRGGVLGPRGAEHGEHPDPGHGGHGGEREPPAAAGRELGVDEVQAEQQHRAVEAADEERDDPHHADPEGGGPGAGRRRRRRGRRGRGLAGAGHGGPPSVERRRRGGAAAGEGEEEEAAYWEEELGGRGGCGPAAGEERLSRHHPAAAAMESGGRGWLGTEIETGRRGERVGLRLLNCSSFWGRFRGRLAELMMIADWQLVASEFPFLPFYSCTFGVGGDHRLMIGEQDHHKASN